MEKGVPVRAISRSIAVLQLINRKGSVSLMEIARAVDLPYPTAMRIVQTLMHEKLVEMEPARKRYRPASMVQSLSLGYRDHGELLKLARPRLAELTRQYGWPVALSTSVGQSVMVRESTYSQTSLAFSSYYPGYTFPILECAAGHVHMAFVDDDTRETMIRGMEEIGMVSLVLDLFKSGKLTRRIREAGYATHDRTLHTANPGKTSSIAVPIIEAGREAGEITLSFFSTAMRMAQAEERFVDALKQTALEIGEELSAERPCDEADATPPPLDADTAGRAATTTRGPRSTRQPAGLVMSA